jgi:hypothetical protein
MGAFRLYRTGRPGGKLNHRWANRNILNQLRPVPHLLVDQTLETCGEPDITHCGSQPDVSLARFLDAKRVRTGVPKDPCEIFCALDRGVSRGPRDENPWCNFTMRSMLVVEGELLRPKRGLRWR